MNLTHEGLRTRKGAFPFTAVATALSIMIGCGSPDKGVRPDPAFTPYIPAFTAGYISARSPIIVQISEGQRWRDSTQAALQELFEIEPGTKGSVRFIDHLTLAFEPEERFAANTVHTVTFHLGRVIEVPAALRAFRFQVTTYPQGIDVRVSDLRTLSTTDLTWNQLLLGVHTSDDATGQDLEGCFTATQNGRELSLTWEHEPNGRFHRLLADSVQRGDAPGSVAIRWNGERIGCTDDSTLTFTVPAIGDLQLLRTETYSDGEQKAELIFSDPLSITQDLTGLAGIANTADVRLAVEGNKLILRPQERLRGAHQAFVAAGLQNIMDRKLGKDLVVDLLFEELKPAVRMVGSGTILPSTNGSLLPFEAVNLNAVDVSVVRIHAENVQQFLQVNSMGGDRELARVGRLVARTTIGLQRSPGLDPHRWNRYFLDLDDLMKTEPGAIYRVELGFRKQHALYQCEGATEAAAPAAMDPLKMTEEDDAEWDRVNDYWYYDDYYYDDYDYSDRDDPCTPSYYGARRNVSRNIFASDIGLIAKRGNDGSMLVACSDLRTTKPLSGVRIDVLDLQRRSMAQLVTDGEGLVTVPGTKHKPFLLVAEHSGRTGYLKLEEGASLSVSSFDVEGEAVDRGIKGFLYGERGVWRPGDSLYLTFILQDAEHKLPKDHPVTFELSDPRGRLDQRMVRTAGVNGMYSFRCATSPDAPTGVWSAVVRVGGTTFHRPVRIETVKPNRLKITLDPGGERLTKATSARIKLQSMWLHGAPARELKARVTTTLMEGTPDFKGYGKFTFNDLHRSLNDAEQVVYDDRLDALGGASFPLELSLGPTAPAMVRVNLVTRVFEAGGDASMDRMEVPYYPYASYAGIKEPASRNMWGGLVTDTTYKVELVAVDPDGRPLAGHALRASIVKVDRHWWWDGGYDNGYMSSPSTTVRSTKDLVTDAKGKATVDLRVDRPEWGRFVVRVEDPSSGHIAAIQTYIDWPGYEGRSQRDEEKSASMLRFNTDREKYTTGELCAVTIPSSGSGRALVSVETGSRVLDARWVTMTGTETKYSFPITADMAPNAYVHVTLVQPHQNTDIDRANDRPIRMYGVVPVLVEDPNTHLRPSIELPSEIRTDEAFSVSVREQDGLPMTYTLAIVDEGLLDLTRFKTPDPWGHFYAREALGVRTWDLYDEVIGAFGRRMDRILAMGGSDAGKPADPTKLTRFKPVVRFAGPFTVAAGKTGKHTFTISDYVGSVRVMVVANDGEKAYGSSDRTVPVRKPLMLLATMPRVVGPGETLDLPVTLFAMDKKVRNAEVRLETNDLFIAQGPMTVPVKFEKPGDQVLRFRVRVAERIGKGTVKVIAEGAGERASTSIEILVRQPNLPRTTTDDMALQAGGKWTLTPEPLGITGTNSAYLEVSTIPPVDLGRRLRYLIDYPHGCVEQTTSKAFPQLYLPDVVEMPVRMQQEARGNVEAAIRKLRSFHRSDGHFSYWPGTTHVDDWCSVYAGHFLVECERKGFAVGAELKNSWLAAQQKLARDWNPVTTGGWTLGHSQLLQAYRLYVLALAGRSDLGAMNRLRTAPTIELQARWTLAAAYALVGRADAADALVKELSTSITPYTQLAYTYGSELRDAALIAEALLRMGRTAQAAPLVKSIAEKLGSGDWYSTQSTAFALMAVARFAEKGDLDKGMKFSLTTGKDPKEHFSEKAVARYDLPVPDGRASFTIVNRGSNVLFARVVRTGTPLPGQERASQEGLVLTTEYRLMDGTIIDPSRLAQGTDFTVEVRIATPGTRGDLQQLALTQVFPSGWEIRNTRLEGTESATQASYFTYQDIRDDRVMTYFDLRRGHTVTYRVNLNASYIGRFYMPAAQCEAMYDRTVNANSTGEWIEVVPFDAAAQATP